MILSVSLASLKSRKGSVFLTLMSLIVSISLLLSVDHIRREAKSSFSRTVSGVELIVAARSSQINVLLSTVFRIGNMDNSISWDSYQTIIQDRQVKWSVPIALGDSHRGYQVLGTTEDYFSHFRYGDKQNLSLFKGREFKQLFEVVLGIEVAAKLGYRIGDNLVLSHGTGATSFHHHEDSPFVVVGILQRTGTPVDKTLHVNLASIEAIHLPNATQKRLVAQVQTLPIPDLGEGLHEHGHHEGHAHEGHDHEEHGHENHDEHEHEEHEEHDSHEDHDSHHEHDTSHHQENVLLADLQPKQITGFFVGLKSPIGVLTVQRKVNQFKGEALSAIVPGVALTQLWQMLSVVENVLVVISGLILLASLFGLATMLLASIRERQNEMAVLRAIGAGPGTIFTMIQLEALVIVVTASVLSVLVLLAALSGFSGYLSEHYGLFLSANIVNVESLRLLLIVIIATFVVANIPALGAYRKALHTGLSGRS